MSDSKVVDEITIESDDEDLGNVSISPVAFPPPKVEMLLNGHDEVNGKKPADNSDNSSKSSSNNNNNNNSNNKMSSNSEPLQAISIVDFEGAFDPPPTSDPVIMSSNSLTTSEENRFSIEADSEPSSSNCLLALPAPPSGQSKMPDEVDAAKKKQERKRRKRPYWGGTEHGHPVGLRQPLIILDKLSDTLIKQAFPEFCGDKGHICKEGTLCRWQQPRVRKPKPPPVNDTQVNNTIDSIPPISSSSMEVDNTCSIINSVAASSEISNFPISYGPHPSIGDLVAFRVRKASSNPAIDSFSEVKTARVISYFQDVQLIEVVMSKPEFVCVSANGERFLADEMIIDWSTVVEGRIVRREVTG
ncbi:uncharacterized protein LOC141858111 [Brevipalpus obovatus]|uniref:uncharacterized protein LOC141858111 n=1 Tax=Brevipalpus obovatus TaxID=246614 RepID=UPI003D9DDEC3